MDNGKLRHQLVRGAYLKARLGLHEECSSHLTPQGHAALYLHVWSILHERINAVKDMVIQGTHRDLV